ncbi:3-hydroxyacyl-CoA dehydrogenase NAD-binding domain-containing protein [Marinovum algicola]|uniref:3-hydroxyacyl-CoA dehydrogenase NAD-binding domain-containing protein n=1 Tax=Marinovum algicola TaxID=42444 RepID=UPI003B51C0C1
MTVELTHDGNLAIVTIDNPPVNVTSQAVRAALLSRIETLERDPAVAAVVLRCAGRTFIAGADATEFDAPPQAPHLPDVIAAVEASDKPWIAALHGTVLGGGLEVAMGCHIRIAAPGTRLGLPEVTLGLIPGAGGTVRLPRLVPGDLALRMIAGSKPITAQDALSAGLIDVIAGDDLLQAALTRARNATGTVPTLSRPVRPFDAGTLAGIGARLVAKARGQVSVAEAVEAVTQALTAPPEDALQAERARFLRLKSSPQCAALRHVFFAERRSLSDPRTKGTAREIAEVGVVGGGTMGAGIATACLRRGFQVRMVERDAATAEAGARRVREMVEESARREGQDAAAVAVTLDRFAAGTEYAALAQADLVIEAVFEEMAVKKAVFAELEAATRPDAILATNTSYLDIDELAATLDDPSRVIGLHFFSPAHVMKLLEIVLPDAVADTVVASAAAFAKRLGKIGVFAGVCDGFIGNRIMSAYRREAEYIVEDGAWPEEVDAAMRDFGFPIGIFEMQDMAGLDIGWAMRKRRATTRDPNERYVAIADRICEAGRLGRKTGAGWYDYVEGRPVPSETVRGMIAAERARQGRTADRPADIMRRLLDAMQAEARAVLADGTARRAEDIDVVMVNGYGFPRHRGGPMFLAGQP